LPENRVQPLLELLYTLQQDLLEITGMDAITLQPAAGAHGELTSLLMAKAYFKDHGLLEKDTVIIPDSAHGTNPLLLPWQASKWLLLSLMKRLSGLGTAKSIG